MHSILSLSVAGMGSSIQFAIAPIFLLVGTGSLLNVVTTRLGRVVDRARVLETLIEDGESERLERRHIAELKVLDKRLKYGNRAVLFCSLSAVLICILVAVLFILVLLAIPAGALVAVLFIAVVTSLSVGLVSFLQEVTLSLRALRVRTEILTRERTAGLEDLNLPD